LLGAWAAGFLVYQVINPGGLAHWSSFWNSVGNWLHTTGHPWLSASVAAYVILKRAAAARAHALVLGAAGPVVALGLVRLLETSDARPTMFALVPPAGAAAALFAGGLVSRLRGRRRAATSQG